MSQNKQIFYEESGEFPKHPGLRELITGCGDYSNLTEDKINTVIGDIFNNRVSRVDRIADSSTDPLKIKGYAVMDSNWISEDDRLIDDKGKEYRILDYQTIEKSIVYSPRMPSITVKYACLKLDKPVEPGTFLYVLNL